MKSYKEKAKIWIWPGESANWHFVYIDKKHSEEIKSKYNKNTRGFGSIPVEVKLGKSKWKTSIFPGSKSGAYLLPLKQVIRRKEEVANGDTVKFEIKILI